MLAARSVQKGIILPTMAHRRVRCVRAASLQMRHHQFAVFVRLGFGAASLLSNVWTVPLERAAVPVVQHVLSVDVENILFLVQAPVSCAPKESSLMKCFRIAKMDHAHRKLELKNSIFVSSVLLDSLRHQKARACVKAARRVHFSHLQVNLCVSTAKRVNFPQGLQLLALVATQASIVVQLPHRALHAPGGRPGSKVLACAPRAWLVPGATPAQMVSATSARQEPILQPAPAHAVDVTVGPTLSKGLGSVRFAQPANMSHRLHTCPAM